MAFIAGLPDNYNILSPVGYKLDISKLPSVSYFCQAANIPDVSLGTTLRANPSRDYSEPGDQLELGTFDITFLVDEDLNNYNEIFTWLKELSGTLGPEAFSRLDAREFGQGSVTNIVLTILTNSMNSNKIVSFSDCFPSQLGAVNFTSNIDSIEPITCDASFTYVDFTISTDLA